MASTLGKQHIDLIRHRELNALRRLMAERTSAPLWSSTLAQTQGQGTPLLQTIARIDALEAQMVAQPDTAFADGVGGGMGGATRFASTLSSSSLAPAHTMALEQTVLHEAAADFAEGQFDRAQRRLLLAVHPQGSRSDHVPTWLALLDLYRATDQAAAFDALTLDFSIRFGRSTPSWVSIGGGAHPVHSTTPTTWTAPAALGTQSLQALSRLMTDLPAQAPFFTIDWRGLASIEHASWEALAAALQTLAQSKAQCTVQGAAHFARFFDTDTAPAALAQLAWLRCQNLPEAFDNAAINYCAAFEVSPPDWIAPACKLSLGDDVFFLKDQRHISRAGQLGDTPAALALSGEVIERLPPMFVQYANAVTRPATTLAVSCERLVRIDPAATLELRLWSSALHAQGVSVTLTHAHRLVATYFLTQGIYAFAKVTPRTD